MKDNPFGISDEIIIKALKEGILVNKNGSFEANPGYISLLWHLSLQRWCLAYGTNPADAGFVILEDYGRLWRLRDAEEEK